MADILDEIIQSEPAVAKAAASIRAARPGDLFPAAEYDWRRHQTDIGLKTSAGEWLLRVSVSHPLTSPAEFALYLRGLAAGLEQSGG